MLEIAGRAAQILVALAGSYLVVLWFALIVWTFRDIETRSRNVFTQVFSTLISVLFFIPGVLLYMLLRPKMTLDETFQRSLEEEYLLQDLEELPHCPSCHRHVEDDFVICPHCHGQLREPCGGCERLVDLRWPLCPYCGIVQSEQGDPTDRVEAPAARWTAPALRRRRSMGGPTRPLSLPDAVEPSREDIAKLLPRSRTGASDGVGNHDDDTSSLAASLASGMRSMVRPLDRLLGRGTSDNENTPRDNRSASNGHVADELGDSTDRFEPDTVTEDRNGTVGDQQDVTAFQPVVVPRNRFASNGGSQKSSENGRTNHQNGFSTDARDALDPFAPRPERPADAPVTNWPDRDQDR